jgi:hypothetical protein
MTSNLTNAISIRLSFRPLLKPKNGVHTSSRVVSPRLGRYCFFLAIYNFHTKPANPSITLAIFQTVFEASFHLNPPSTSTLLPLQPSFHFNPPLLRLTYNMGPKVLLHWIIGTQSLEKIDKQRLETVRTRLSVLQKRQEEIDREKESKILTLEVQLVNTAGEKVQQAETIKRLEEENTTLKQDIIKLEDDITNMKYENTRLVEQSAVVIEGLETKIRGLDDTVASIEKKLSFARRVIAHHKEKAEPALRQKRRIAMKLLACVMELDDDVAVPGEQRPVSAHRALEEAPIVLSKALGVSIFTPASSKLCQ